MGVLVGSIAIVGSLLQFALIIQGLTIIGRSILPFSSKEKNGWFGLWGGWHFLVTILLFKFAGDKFSAVMETFQKVAFELESLKIISTYLLLPLVVSLLISQIHLYLRNR